jgi:hypothetical protein
MSAHKKLKVITTRPDTEVWVGDADGHFVCKGVGGLEEGLLPGKYVVSFGLKGKKHEVVLDPEWDETEIHQDLLGD